MSYTPNIKSSYWDYIPDNVAYLMDEFARHEIECRIVGGAVRDIVMGYEPKDYDIVFASTPDRFLEVCQEMNFRVILDGFSHGIIKVVSKDGEVIDFAACRSDVSTDGRHAKVQYGVSFDDDAKRRDFTINSMSLNSEGRLFDPNNGMQDIIDKRLRFIGNPNDRIKEDYLRILRFIRFMVRYNLKPAEFSLSAIKPKVKLLSTISKERIVMEMRGIFNHSFGKTQIDFINDSKVFSEILGVKLKLVPQFQHAPNYWVVKSLRHSYFYNGPKTVLEFFENYPVSNAEKREANSIVNACQSLDETRNLNYIRLKYADHIKQIGVFWNMSLDSALPEKPYNGKYVIDNIPGIDLVHVKTVLEEMDKVWCSSEFKATAVQCIRSAVNTFKNTEVFGPYVEKHMTLYVDQLEASMEFLKFASPEEYEELKPVFNELNAIWRL